MDLHWVPPLMGVLKVNVHAVSFDTPLPNDNTTRRGMVLRTSYGNLVNYIAGTISGLFYLANHLWDILVGTLRWAFLERGHTVILEPDNLEAFGAVQFAHLHQHLEVDHINHQILTTIRDPNWICNLGFIFPEWNHVSEYLSLRGGELFRRLYIFYEPIGRMGDNGSIFVFNHTDFGYYITIQKNQITKDPI